MKEQIRDWLDHVFENQSFDNIKGIAFNIYEDGDDAWSFEVVGTATFDESDSDWACDEITDFGTRENPFAWTAVSGWESILQEVFSILQEYLDNGKYSELLKSFNGVGVGFVDGDMEILYTHSHS